MTEKGTDVGKKKRKMTETWLESENADDWWEEEEPAKPKKKKKPSAASWSDASALVGTTDGTRDKETNQADDDWWAAQETAKPKKKKTTTSTESWMDAPALLGATDDTLEKATAKPKKKTSTESWLEASALLRNTDATVDKDKKKKSADRLALEEVLPDLKDPIVLKSEQAMRELFKKIQRVARIEGDSAKSMERIIRKAVTEYDLLFGRLGSHPLLQFQDKEQPRYLAERDETWTMYKPPLWNTSGQPRFWEGQVKRLISQQDVRSLQDAKNLKCKSGQVESLPQWHGMCQRLNYLDETGLLKRWGFESAQLDVETDGPMVIGKTWRAQRCFEELSKAKLFTSGFIALVHGRVANRQAQHIRKDFAELGAGDQGIMFRFDYDADPLFEFSEKGRWSGRSIRGGECFIKPMAYYLRSEDSTEYTLVYVNTITPMPRAIQVMLQSIGHPLVSDEVYLPKAEALSDLKWCPRTFLSKVRYDWFDLCGPHKDESRRRYTRISEEQPLPRALQLVLETKIVLIEQIDKTADLYTGCQYWAIGDENLSNAYQKDAEYRQRIMRWGQRHGIHLDAMDRLLLLPELDVDLICSKYKPPLDRKSATWVCPECLAFNSPMQGRDPDKCSQAAFAKCLGTPRVEDETPVLPKGWFNWAADPTIHFLLLVNHKYLGARRKVLGPRAPEWEKAAWEPRATPSEGDNLVALEAAIMLDAKKGGNGLMEQDLSKVPGLENVSMPLSEPLTESNVRRTRLSGCGARSQWRYALKGSFLWEHTHKIDKKVEKLKAPVPVETEKLPEKMFLSRQEKLDVFKKKRQEADDKMETDAKAAEEEAFRKADEFISKMRRIARSPWKKVESSNRPGQFYYHNSHTGESAVDKPADFEEPEASAAPEVWKRVESKRRKGEFYFHNKLTGETRVDPPPGFSADGTKSSESNRWERLESKTKAGQFYYFDSTTGSNEMTPPTVEMPWKLIESKTKRGQFFYFNTVSRQSSVNPPSSARPSTTGSKEKAGEKKVEETKTKTEWEKKVSRSTGKPYYVHSKTGETRVDPPPGVH